MKLKKKYYHRTWITAFSLWNKMFVISHVNHCFVHSFHNNSVYECLLRHFDNFVSYDGSYGCKTKLFYYPTTIFHKYGNNGWTPTLESCTHILKPNLVGTSQSLFPLVTSTKHTLTKVNGVYQSSPL